MPERQTMKHRQPIGIPAEVSEAGFDAGGRENMLEYEAAFLTRHELAMRDGLDTFAATDKALEAMGLQRREKRDA